MAFFSPSLFALLRGYSSLVPPRKLEFPTNEPLNVVADFLLNSIFLNDHLTLYPPSTAYQRSFWKWAIQNLESFLQNSSEAGHPDVEIDARIYEHYLSILPPSESTLSSSNSTPLPSYITRFWGDKIQQAQEENVNVTRIQTIVLLESRTTIESGTTGLTTWTASIILAHYIILHPTLVTNKRVLELGSGTGFLGIVVGSLQRDTGGSLCMTDVNEEALERCQNNVRLPCNRSSTHKDISFRSLDWSDVFDTASRLALESLLSADIDAEVILGADLVFDPALIPDLVSTLFLALATTSSTPKVAFIALTLRNETTMDLFLRTCKKDLNVEDLLFDVGNHAVFMDFAWDRSQIVRIFKVTRARPSET